MNLTIEINGTFKKVEAKNESEAYDKAKEILCETLDEEPEFWNCVEVKPKDKDE